MLEMADRQGRGERDADNILSGVWAAPSIREVLSAQGRVSADMQEVLALGQEKKEERLIFTQMKPLRHASLFSGIGAAEIAAEMLGWENIFHCEINPFGRKVLEYWFPNSHSYEDITKTDFSQYRGQIDVLSGGFPCQPFSYAGKRGGENDDRYLWQEMLRVVDQVRPMWVIGENVNGITTMVESYSVIEMGCESSLFNEGNGVHRYRAEQTFTIERVCRDLESKGYSVQPMLVPACAVGAPHRRDRIFILAYNVADSDCSNDLRESGEYESKSSKEWISERNEIRQFGKPSDVRYQIGQIFEDTLRYGCRVRQEEEQRSKWDIGDIGTRDSEWVCREERSVFSSDTYSNRGGEIYKYLQSEFTNGAEFICDGRIRNVTDSGSKGLEGKNKSRSKEGGEWVHIWRDIAGCYRKDSLVPRNRWKGFPTISPVHRGNDGFPFDVDNLTIPFAKWRTESLKAYGNAIVPQVIYQIMKCINEISTNQ